MIKYVIGRSGCQTVDSSHVNLQLAQQTCQADAITDIRCLQLETMSQALFIF